MSALTFKASSTVNLLNDDTYRWDCATVIMSSFRQIEQGTHLRGGGGGGGGWCMFFFPVVLAEKNHN